MKSGNTKTSDPHSLLLNLLYKTNLKRSVKYVALSNSSMHEKYFSWKNMKKSCKNNKFKISAPK